jgi:putative phosphoesterase
MKRIGLISDTHGYMDSGIEKYLKNVDEIWHAGDIGKAEVTDFLKGLAPLKAVYGNIDDGKLRQEFPENAIFTTEGAKVLITHIAGRPGRYPSRVKNLISVNKPDVFVCGHSHICLVQYLPNLKMLHLNPGAAGRSGFHKVRTLLRFSIEEGKVSNLEVVELGPRSSANSI